MEALKLVQEQKANPTVPNTLTKTSEYKQITEADLIKLFPLPRYFQIHFQYVHENTDTLKTDIQDLKDTVLQINTKLDLLIQLLTQTHN